MDVSRLRQGEKIAAVSGLALFIFMFFSWFGAPNIEINGVDITGSIEAAGGDTTLNAWQSFDFIDIILLVTVIVAVGLAAATAASTTINLPVAASALTAGFGILSTLLVLYRVINPIGDPGLDRKIGLFLGLIAAAGVAYGGWQSMQEEGTSFGAQADRLGGGDEPPAGPPTGGPPPPPSASSISVAPIIRAPRAARYRPRASRTPGSRGVLRAGSGFAPGSSRESRRTPPSSETDLSTGIFSPASVSQAVP